MGALCTFAPTNKNIMTTKKQKTFTFHKVMMEAKIPHTDRLLLGKEMANAYFAVMGEKPKRLVIDKRPQRNGMPRFSLSIYPIEFLPIALNIMDSYFQKNNTPHPNIVSMYKYTNKLWWGHNVLNICHEGEC